MNRAQIRMLARTLIDENSGQEWLPDSADNENGFDLDLMVDESMDEFARQSLAFTVNYTISATPGQDIYKFSEFGTQEAPAAGSRIFRAKFVGYDHKALDELTESQVSGLYRDWRWASSGRPECWMQHGEGIRLWRTPGDNLDLYLEGFEVPDNTLWAADDGVPPLNRIYHKLIAMGAIWAIVAIMNPSAEDQFRASALGQVLSSGYADARHNLGGTRARIAAGSGETAEMGPAPISQRAIRIS